MYITKEKYTDNEEHLLQQEVGRQGHVAIFFFCFF